MPSEAPDVSEGSHGLWPSAAARQPWPPNACGPCQQRPSNATPHEAASPVEEAPAGSAAEGLSYEFRHFRDLVVQDFYTASGEVKASFGYVASCVAHRPRVSAVGRNALHGPELRERSADGASAAQPRPQQGQQAHPGQEQPGQEQQGQQLQQPRRQWSARDVAPVAAAVTGAVVASSLVPVRVFRLAVGSFKAAAGATSIARVGAPEAGAGAGGLPQPVSPAVAASSQATGLSDSDSMQPSPGPSVSPSRAPARLSGAEHLACPLLNEGHATGTAVPEGTSPQAVEE